MSLLLAIALLAAAPVTNPSQITFTGNAGTRRALADKLADVVSVKDYGAKGDGSTDDTAAIQGAIAAAAGKTLEFPTGTYKLTAALNISTASGLTLRGKGATLASTQPIIFNFSGASSGVTFDGFKFSTSDVSSVGVSGLITGIMAAALSNIRVFDCEFSAATSATNAIKFDVSNVASSLTGLEVAGSRFLNIGRMGVEIVNHTFDDLSRYEQVRIINNRFDTLGTATAFGQAVSFSGMGKNNAIVGNSISNTVDLAIELVGPWTTTVANNTIRNLPTSAVGISQGKPLSATLKPQGLVFSGNSIEGPTSGFAAQLAGMQDASVSGNVVTGNGKFSVETSDYVTLTGNTIDVTNQVQFLTDTNVTSSGNLYANRTNTVGFNPDIQSTTLSTFTGDKFYSERGTGLLVDGTSANNTFVGCTFSNENSAAAGNALQFNGAGVTGNVVIAGRFRRTAAGGTTWAQVSTTGNQIGASSVNTFNPDSVVANTPLGIATNTNAWLTPVLLGTSRIYVDNNARLRRKASDPTSDGDGTAWSPSNQGTITLVAGSGTATVVSGVTCFCQDTTANASVKCAVATTTLTATGTGTDVIAYVCF